MPNLGSVLDITKETIALLGHIDLVIFGSPCQDLSVAGKQKGFTHDDGSTTRSGLFHTALKICKWSNARFWLWENVPGAFSSNKGADFASVVSEMAGCGNVTTPKNGWGSEGVAVGDTGMLEWAVLDAQWYGLAQRRKRVFAILDTGDWASRHPILLERKSLRGDTTPSREAGKDVTKHLTAGVAQRYDFEPDIFITEPISIVGNIIGRSPENGGNGDGFDESGVSYTLTKTDVHVVAYTPTVSGTLAASGAGTSRPAGQGNELDFCLAFHVDAQPDEMKFDEHVTSTLTTSQHAEVFKGTCVRRLTPKECCRLQGFPDDYLDIFHNGKPVADTNKYKALGNSMAVPVIRYIGEQIEKALLTKVN